MTADLFAKSTPAAEGVAADAVDALLDALEGAPAIDPHSLMLLRHGKLIAAGWWAPYTADRRHLLYSLSKSFTSTAAGLAVADGVLRLDDPVISYFPEFDADIKDPGDRSILVRHVAAMASGHVEETWPRAVANDPDHPVRGFLLLPPDRDPGSVFAYNQSATYSLAAIVQRQVGQTVTSYLNRRLLAPLGADRLASDQFPVGQDRGYSGMYATTGTIAALGQLYLQLGAWKGTQLLAPEWVREATRSHVSTRPEPGLPRQVVGQDWVQGYGFQFWMSRHGYRGDGAYGQYCLVLPQYDAVLAMTGATVEMQGVLSAVWQLLLPGFGDSPLPVTAADARLEARLGSLSVPAFASQSAPADQSLWADTTFVPPPGRPEGQETLLAVRVNADHGGWRVTLSEDGYNLSTTLRSGAWVVNAPEQAGDDIVGVVPVACTGGWTDRGTLRFEVIFLETPHRLVVTCKLPEGTFDAQWVTTPLGLPSEPPYLKGLRSPGLQPDLDGEATTRGAAIGQGSSRS